MTGICEMEGDHSIILLTLMCVFLFPSVSILLNRSIEVYQIYCLCPLIPSVLDEYQSWYLKSFLTCHFIFLGIDLGIHFLILPIFRTCFKLKQTGWTLAKTFLVNYIIIPVIFIPRFIFALMLRSGPNQNICRSVSNVTNNYYITKYTEIGITGVRVDIEKNISFPGITLYLNTTNKFGYTQFGEDGPWIPIAFPLVYQSIILCLGLVTFFASFANAICKIRKESERKGNDLFGFMKEKSWASRFDSVNEDCVGLDNEGCTFKSATRSYLTTLSGNPSVKTINVCPADPENRIVATDSMEEKYQKNMRSNQMMVAANNIKHQDVEVLYNQTDLRTPSPTESVHSWETSVSSRPVSSDGSHVTTQTIEEDYHLRNPMGVAVIINNQNFEFLHTRECSQCDQDKLEESFKFLGFDVKLHNDLAAEEMRTCLSEYSRQNHSEMSIFVCCVMTHGLYGKLCGEDGETIRIDEITEMFSEQNAPTLKNKPKLFVFVSCQHTVNDSHPALTLPDKHFLVMYSTLLGNSSIRNTETGTPFINCLVRDLNKYGENEDLLNITRNANKHMEVDYADSTGLNLACEISSSLDKKLILGDAKKRKNREETSVIII